MHRVYKVNTVQIARPGLRDRMRCPDRDAASYGQRKNCTTVSNSPSGWRACRSALVVYEDAIQIVRCRLGEECPTAGLMSPNLSAQTNRPSIATSTSTQHKHGSWFTECADAASRYWLPIPALSIPKEGFRSSVGRVTTQGPPFT